MDTTLLDTYILPPSTRDGSFLRPTLLFFLFDFSIGLLSLSAFQNLEQSQDLGA